MTPDEVRMLDNRYSLLFVRGERPVKDLKYDILKHPNIALKLFIRFAIAKGVVTYGLELMMAIFTIIQGVVSTIMRSSGIAAAGKTTLPKEMVKAIEDCGFFESIPLCAVTLIGSLVITVLSFIIILTVYGRFFKMSDAIVREMMGL